MTDRVTAGHRLQVGIALVALAAAPALLAAQNPPLPSPSQASQVLQQAVQQNPGIADVIRQRLSGSGMTPDQIRARLQAAGYPPTLLDAYLGQAQPGQPALVPGVQELAAVQALGLQPIAVPVESLPVDTGLVRAAELGARGISGPTSPVFGVDVFRRNTTQFLPLLAGPVPPDYALGPGDELVLILTGDVELSYTLDVTREGFVVIPQVGELYVSNLTLAQLNELLKARLGRVYSGIKTGTTRFSVSVANVRANQVYVTGEVAQPGAYQISSLGTVLTSLYAAGGPTDAADLREVAVRRDGKLVTTFDLYDYLLRGDTKNDVRLETGDVVFVPIHAKRVRILGSVRRPYIYDLKGDETLADLVAAAGGFRPNADASHVSVFRVLPPATRGPATYAREAIAVAVPKGGPVPPFAMADGDSVVVDSLPGIEGGYFVAVTGMVEEAGRYPWRPGMTLRDLLRLARGPRVGADLREAEIARLPADRSAGQLATTIRVPLDSSYLIQRDSAGRYIGPPGVATAPSGAPEVELQPYDNVLILREPNFELQRVVDIEGEVRYPGTYALKSKTDRIADLVARAGGLTPQAYAAGIRFIRSENGVGRIDIDLAHALQDTTSDDNIILQPDDSLYVPEYQPSVRVSGQVNAPGSVLWQPGADLDYYIRAAGGFTYAADGGRVSVHYANGQVKTPHHVMLFFKSTPAPGPGSEVVVPTKDLSHPTDWVALVGGIAQVLASTVAILVIATKL